MKISMIAKRERRKDLICTRVRTGWRESSQTAEKAFKRCMLSPLFLVFLTVSSFVTSMSQSNPTVKELLSQSDDEIVAYLGGIYEHSAWVAQALCAQDTSNIDTVTALSIAMKEIVEKASEDSKLQLLCAHPDLCEKVAALQTLTAESQEEQSRAGLQSLTPEELETFTKCNTEYREKFGFPFILAVRNATKYTVLAALEGRVGNPREVEFAGALQQVHKIAWMRLLACINTDDAKGFLTCHVLDTANGCPGTACCFDLSLASLAFTHFISSQLAPL